MGRKKLYTDEELRLRNIESAKRSALQNPEKTAENKRRYVRNHPELVAESKKRWKENNEVNDLISKRKYKLKKYGLTLDQYREMLLNQNGVCAICSKEEEDIGKLLAVDHSHTDLKIRGLLCRRCNVGISRFDGDLDWLKKALDYLGVSLC